MAKLRKAWVLTENLALLPQFCNASRQISDEVSVLLIGSRADAEKAIRLGASKVYWLKEKSDTSLFEDYEKTIFELLLKEQPELLVVQSSKRGRHVAGTLAAKLGTSVIADVSELLVDEHVLARHMIYGGAALRTEEVLSGIAIVTASEGLSEPCDEDVSLQGELIDVEVSPSDAKLRLVEKKAKQSAEVNLNAAKRVVGVGRGFAAQEDLKMAEALSASIEAEIGCTRPLSEGVNWLPAERYIGVSGAMLKPDVYFALGISGQIQHMVGVNQARVVIAINKDSSAPIFKQADLSIVGDIYKILPKLIDKIEAGQ